MPSLRRMGRDTKLAFCTGIVPMDMYRSTVWRVYDMLTDVGLPLLLAGFGYFALAGLLLLAQLSLKSWIYRSLAEAVSDGEAAG